MILNIKYIVKSIDKAKKVLFQGKLRNQFMNQGQNPGHEFDELEEEEEDEKKPNILSRESLLFRNEKDNLNIRKIIERKKLKGNYYIFINFMILFI